MDDIIFEIWHNPKCSKSREALTILRGEGIEPNIREYLKDSPHKESLEYVCMLLGVSPIEITRTKESIWKENGIDPKTLSDSELLAMLELYPETIERPIIIKNGDEAVLGRPAENIWNLFE